MRKDGSTETQEKILKLWEEVLGTTGFGIESNFFELGGHSLKATKFKNLVLSCLTSLTLALEPLLNMSKNVSSSKPKFLYADQDQHETIVNASSSG